MVNQVGDMAALLRARLRWVVTGTPMGNGGLRDLHGLLRVLQHDPFQDRGLWRICVEQPCLRGALPFQCSIFPFPCESQIHRSASRLHKHCFATMLNSRPRT